MSTVTYHHQPGIHKTRGTVPLIGTSHVYTVSKILWPEAVEEYISSLLIDPTLHVCCGKSQLGSIRVDLYEEDMDIRCDAARLPFKDASWTTVLIDPPYNGVFDWNHRMLEELSRVASQRIIFQHWFLMADKYGRYKKNHKFVLSDVSIWQPKTYFGRVNVIQVFDHI